MTNNDELELLRQRLEGLTSPPASAGELARILERVNRGETVRLGDVSRGRSALRWGIGTGLVAAGFVLVAAIALHAFHSEPRSDPHAVDGDLFMLGPSPLLAQATRPESPRIVVPEGKQLPVGRWVYAVQPIGGQVTPEAGRFDTAAVARVVLGAQPIYVLTWSWGSRLNAGPMVDSAFVTVDHLAPLRHVFYTRAGSTLTTRFSDDTVTRVWNRPNGSVEELSARIGQSPEWRRGATLVGYDEWALFALLRLRRDWTGHVATMALANTGELVTLFRDYRVTGEATVTVPAGTYQCWAVSDADPRSDYTRWVDKRTGWVVKEGSRSNRLGRERVLVSFQPTE